MNCKICNIELNPNCIKLDHYYSFVDNRYETIVINKDNMNYILDINFLNKTSSVMLNKTFVEMNFIIILDNYNIDYLVNKIKNVLLII